MFTQLNCHCLDWIGQVCIGTTTQHVLYDKFLNLFFSNQTVDVRVCAVICRSLCVSMCAIVVLFLPQLL